MNDTRFIYLLERHRTKQATPLEEEEFKALIQSGKYRDRFRDELARFMEERSHSANDEEVPVDGERLYERILAKRQQSEDDHQTQGRSFGLFFRIAAMITLGLGIGWWALSPSQKSGQIATTGKTVEEVVHFTRKDFIRLPDGSSVLLNDDSELTYHTSFGDSTREVTLRGEAFFDIVHNPEKPFVVHTGDITTRVLGTAFNINARDKQVMVTVERGLVKVADRKQTLSLVHPSEKLVVNTIHHRFEKTEIKLTEEIAWKSESLVFDNISLKQVVGLLKTHFGADIRIDNPAIENCRVSAWFLDNESLDEILEMICQVRQARYTRTGDAISISGGIGCN